MNLYISDERVMIQKYKERDIYSATEFARDLTNVLIGRYLESGIESISAKEIKLLEAMISASERREVRQLIPTVPMWQKA